MKHTVTFEVPSYEADEDELFGDLAGGDHEVARLKRNYCVFCLNSRRTGLLKLELGDCFEHGVMLKFAGDWYHEACLTTMMHGLVAADALGTAWVLIAGDIANYPSLHSVSTIRACLRALLSMRGHLPRRFADEKLWVEALATVPE